MYLNECNNVLILSKKKKKRVVVKLYLFGLIESKC